MASSLLRYPYLDEDAQGNPRISSYPLLRMPSELRERGLAELFERALRSLT